MNFGRYSLLAAVSACVLRGWATLVPSWLPESFRFDVTNCSQACEAVVSSNLQSVISFIPEDLRTRLIASNQLGAHLQWLVRRGRVESKPEAYLTDYAHPRSFSVGDFELSVLTSLASRVQSAPLLSEIEIVYGDGYDTKGYLVPSIHRPVAGIDYPGVASEEMKLNPYLWNVTLKSPVVNRVFRVRAKGARFGQAVACQYAWIPMDEVGRRIFFRCWGRDQRLNPEWGFADLVVCYPRIFPYPVRSGSFRVAVFARDRDGFWGVPSFITIASDPKSKREYEGDNVIKSITYARFTDKFDSDANGNIIGFTRVRTGEFFGDEYAPNGEKVLDKYGSGRVRRARKIGYFEEDGELDYKELDEVFYPTR